MPSYLDAGVDLEGADRHVTAIRSLVTATWGDRVSGGFGGFAAGIAIPEGLKNPVMMMSTDGVGTKLELARQSGMWGGVGHDLVAMCVDDLAAVGASPLGFVDYMAVGALSPDRDTAIVRSIAGACEIAGCALLGGETAEHPGVMAADAVDLAGTAAGIVESGAEFGPHRVSAGDVIIGLHSPNLRSNGFSLIRKLFDSDPPYTSLLAPSVIYSPAVLKCSELINSAAHITGGGIPGNLSRALPEHLGAEIERSSWDAPEIFATISSQGVTDEEMLRTFNMGIGFCLVVSPENAHEIKARAEVHQPRAIGTVTESPGVVIE